MGRTFCIGDIHGCAAALAGLLKAIRPNSDDTVVTLGDYVDRGPQSSQVLEILTDLISKTQLIPILGNHEVMMINAFEGKDAMRYWLSHGGDQTVQSYGGDIGNMPPHHRMFLQHCRKFHEINDHFFVHASYRPDLDLEQQPDDVLLWEHLKYSAPVAHMSGKKAWVGHTPQEDGEVYDLGHLALIDTYCFGGGYLTAVDVHSGEFWQVEMDGSPRKGSNWSAKES